MFSICLSNLWERESHPWKIRMEFRRKFPWIHRPSNEGREADKFIKIISSIRRPGIFSAEFLLFFFSFIEKLQKYGESSILSPPGERNTRLATDLTRPTSFQRTCIHGRTSPLKTNGGSSRETRRVVFRGFGKKDEERNCIRHFSTIGERIRGWYRGREGKKDPFPGWEEERVGARWIADWVIMLGGDHRAWCGNGWHRLVKGNRPDDSTCIRRDKVVYTRRAYLTIRRSPSFPPYSSSSSSSLHCPFLPISQHRSRRRDKGRRGELVRTEEEEEEEEDTYTRVS